MIVNGYRSFGGSVNPDARLLNDYECGVGILDRKVGEEMEAIFQQDLQDSKLITEKDLTSWPIHERALGGFSPWFRSYL